MFRLACRLGFFRCRTWLGCFLVLGFCYLHAQTVELNDVTGHSGVSFVHENGAKGHFWLPEVIGSGVAVLDFNHDGFLDLWLIQSGVLDARNDSRFTDQIYLNEAEPDEIKFKNVTGEYGLDADRYGMGIATGDIDNDGDLDVFLANFGSNQLFENREGSFRDISEEAGIQDSAWSVAATFFDYDQDSFLDLYIVNYVEFSLETHKNCLGISTLPDYCTPNAYAPAADQLLRNNGDGTFQDISQESGILAERGNGLGVLALDINLDGNMDIYVANDATPNFLWVQDERGKFKESAIEAGVAVNVDGKSEASMGVDVADVDQDCDLDLFVTNLTGETNTLYINSGKGWFRDQTRSMGLASTSHPFTGFGTRWIDVENDGDLDLVSVNGTVSNQAQAQSNKQDGSFSQSNQLWLNRSGKYSLACRGDFCDVKDVSRGLATGDLDNDGDLDLVVSNNNGPTRIYRNETTSENWIGFALRQSVGAKIGMSIKLLGEPCIKKRFRTDGSYASASDYRVVIGLGSRKDPVDVMLEFPDGSSLEYAELSLNRYHMLEK